MLPVFLQGLSLGLAFLAPIGMQNLFVINSALSHTFGRALATSLVVVFWDISLGITCFLGAGALMDAFPWLKKIMLGLGGLLVIYIGIGLIRTEASLDGGKDVNQPFLKIVVAAFVVTWLNPQALIDGTMMLGAFRATLPAGGDLPSSSASRRQASFGSTALPLRRICSEPKSIRVPLPGSIASAAL